jgi:hypothetical protein
MPSRKGKVCIVKEFLRARGWLFATTDNQYRRYNKYKVFTFIE